MSGDADPVTGEVGCLDGQASVIGGTSAVAPLWAGFTACINSSLGKNVGDMASLVYSQVAPVQGTFNDVTAGNIGAFNAGPGWDACTGNGTPVGSAILAALTAAAPAKP